MALSKPISYSVSKKLNFLTKGETAEILQENFCRYFKRRTDLLDSVVKYIIIIFINKLQVLILCKSVNKGKYYKNLIGTIVSEINETLSCST